VLCTRPRRCRRRGAMRCRTDLVATRIILTLLGFSKGRKGREKTLKEGKPNNNIPGDPW